MAETSTKDFNVANVSEGVSEVVSQFEGIHCRRPFKDGPIEDFISQESSAPDNSEVVPPCTREDLPSQPATPNQESQERTCRICFGGEEEEALGKLISPCKCKGTMKYVHIDCLNSWRNASSGLNSESAFFKCNSCQYKYHFSRARAADLVTSRGARFVLTLTVLFLLIFTGGFCAKYIMSKVDLSPESLETIDTGFELNIEDIANSLELTRINEAHFIFGTFFVGVVGFLCFMLQMIIYGTITVIGIRLPIFNYQRDASRAGGRGKPDSGAAIILAIVVLVGICHSFYTIYTIVSNYSKKWLEALGSQILEVGEERDSE